MDTEVGVRLSADTTAFVSALDKAVLQLGQLTSAINALTSVSATVSQQIAALHQTMVSMQSAMGVAADAVDSVIPPAAELSEEASALSEGIGNVGAAASQAQPPVIQLGDAVQKASGGLNAFNLLVGAGTAALLEYTRQSVLAAAGVSEMDRTMSAVARSSGVSQSVIEDTASAVESMGIEMESARQIAVKFAKNQLDMASASRLARAAQDLAVVSQSNSTQTLERLIHGVMTQNSLVLKNAGITGQAGDMMQKYAQSLGVVTTALTPAQRQTAIINGIMEEAEKVAGAYEESMNEVGKVLRSYPRVLNNTKVAFGGLLLGGIEPVVLGTYKLVDAFQKSLRVYPANVRGTYDWTEQTGGLVHVMTALEDVMRRVLAPIGEFAFYLTDVVKGISVTREQAGVLAARFEGLLPLVAGVATGLSTIAANALLAKLPFAGLAKGISSTSVGLIAFLLTSTDVRDALIGFFQAMAPLVQALARAGAGIADVASELLSYLTPAIAAVIEALTEMITPFMQFLSESERGQTVVRTLAIGFLALKTGALGAMAAMGKAALAKVAAMITAITNLTVGNNLASASMHRLAASQRIAAAASTVFARGMAIAKTAVRSFLSATGMGLLLVAFGLLVEAIMKAWQANGKFVDVVVKGGNILIGAFEYMINAAIKFFNLFLPAQAEFAEVTLKRIDRALIGVGNTLDDMEDGEFDWSYLDEYAASAQGAGDATDYLGQAMDRFRQQMDRLMQTVYEFRRWTEDATDFRDPYVKAMEEVAYQTSKFDGIMADTTQTSDELVSAFTDMAGKIRNALGSALQFASTQLENAKREFDDFSSAISQAIVKVMSLSDAMDVRRGLRDSFDSLREMTSSAVLSLLEFRDLVSVSPSQQYVGFVRALGEAMGALGGDEDTSFVGNLRKRQEQMAEFAAMLGQLSSMGLSEGALRQVTSAGYEAGLEIGRQIIEGGQAAVTEVNELLSSMFDLASATGETVAGEYYDLGSGMGASLLEGLQGQAEKAAEFAARIRELVTMGLAPSAIREVLAAGVDAGMELADALIDGGVTLVDEVNRMYEATAQLAAETGLFGSEKFFKAGVDSAQAFMDALIAKIRDEVPRLDNLLIQMAEKLEALALADAAAMREAAGQGVTDLELDNIGAQVQALLDQQVRDAQRFQQEQSRARAVRRNEEARGVGRSQRLGTYVPEGSVGIRSGRGERMIVIEQQNNTFTESLDFQKVEQQMEWMFGTNANAR